MQGNSVPGDLYTAAQVQSLDRYAIESGRVDGYQLMRRAASCVVKLLRFRWPESRRIAVICGPGNNGGDGLVVARLLLHMGLEVKTGLLGSEAALRGDSRRAFEDFSDAGGELLPIDTCIDQGTEIVVDALFGSGLSRPVQGRAADIITTMNGSPADTIAVDVPSGLCSTTGTVLGTAVRAAATMTFIGCKCGLLTADGPDHTGSLLFDDLDVPGDVYNSLTPAVSCISSFRQVDGLRKRPHAMHKGQCGNVLLVGGNVGYAGAIRLAARACLRTGAGRVTIVCHPDSGNWDAGTPEIMLTSAHDPAAIMPGIGNFDVIAIGPGLGVDNWARGFMHAMLRAGKPLVLDADALNLLNEFPQTLPNNSVLTPHPAEAGRLLQMDTIEVQSDRFKAVTELGQKFTSTALLKGNGTLIGSGDRVTLINAGNPDMASAGMGDALTGIIASFIGQGMPAERAAITAAALHAEAGDVASEQFGRGLTACDVIEACGDLLACR